MVFYDLPLSRFVLLFNVMIFATIDSVNNHVLSSRTVSLSRDFLTGLYAPLVVSSRRRIFIDCDHFKEPRLDSTRLDFRILGTACLLKRVYGRKT